MTITLVVVGKHREECAQFSYQHVVGSVDELIVLANPGATYGGLGAIGNRALRNSKSDVVGLIHADTELGDGTVGALGRTALGCRALTGIVGRSFAGENIWSRDIAAATSVSTLDSCAVFIPRKLAPDLTFDETTFDGFHCCVEDLCVQALLHDLSVLVAPGPADHRGSMWPEVQWMSEYRRYYKKLVAKWPHVPFATT